MKTKRLIYFISRGKPHGLCILLKGIVPANCLLLVLMTLYSFVPAPLSESIELEKIPNLMIENNLRSGIDGDPLYTELKIQNPITGTVEDLGGPIPGVFVQVKDTNRTTMTDENGYYSISASPGEVLVFSYPGYETVEWIVGLDTVIDIEMYESFTYLDEAVINAGYYTVKDRERTGSIYRVTADEIEKQPVNNVLGALEGRIPGVEVTPTTGLAGGGYTVRIRGQNSIAAGNEPLYIIDGVPYDMNTLSFYGVSLGILPTGNVSPLNTLDPSTIESIEVLKDADATAIYGSRGANGVILITTKKGVYGKTNFSIEASNSVISVTKFLDLLNTEQYLAMRKKAFENDGITTYPANAYDINGTWDQSRYTDWQKEFAGNNAYNQNFRVLISGGSEQTRFSLGSSFMKETTVYPSDFNYKKSAIFANLGHNSKNKRLELQFSMHYGFDSNKLPSSDLYTTGIRLSPNAPELYDSDGNLNWENYTWNNPLTSLNASYHNKTKNLILNGALSYELLKGIKISSNFGYNESDISEVSFSPYTIYSPSLGLTSENSTSYHSEANRYTWLIEPKIDASYEFGKSRINITVGGSLQQKQSNGLRIFARGYPTEMLLGQLSASSNISIEGENYIDYKYISAFARINYIWDDKYILNLTGRRDGSSRFGPGNQLANFGAIGFAWIFTNENFLSGLSWLNFGKLRGSFGVTGNDQIGDYQYLDTYSVSNQVYDGYIGFTPTRLLNPDYGWEKNRKAEIALELRLVKNRIQLEASYYDNRSDNQLLGMPLPGTTGFSSMTSNLDATVKNTGFELSINTTNVRKTSLNWETGINLTIPRNELVSFEKLEGSPYVNRFVVGQPLQIIKLYHLVGVNQDTGLYEFEDYNDDGVITSPMDMQFIGDLSPKFLASVSNTLKYKEWSLDFMFQYVKKNAFNEFRGFNYLGSLSNQPIGALNNWDENGSNGIYQTFTAGGNQDAFTSYSRFVSSSGIISDASFLRLKTATLSYNLKLKNLADCKIYIQGSNLLTFTNFKGGDPERLVNYLPPLKRFQLGVKINF